MSLVYPIFLQFAASPVHPTLLQFTPPLQSTPHWINSPHIASGHFISIHSTSPLRVAPISSTLNLSLPHCFSSLHLDRSSSNYIPCSFPFPGHTLASSWEWCSDTVEVLSPVMLKSVYVLSSVYRVMFVLQSLCFGSAHYESVEIWESLQCWWNSPSLGQCGYNVFTREISFQQSTLIIALTRSQLGLLFDTTGGHWWYIFML